MVDALLSLIPIEHQDRVLLQVATELELAVERTSKLIDGWHRADLSLIESAIREMPVELYQPLFVRRNEQWADSIVKGLCEAPDALILVGCGHLVGPDSLLASLAKRGVHFERVK